MQYPDIFNDNYSVIFILLYAFGFISALDALFQTRSSQGAVAWFLSLLFIPPVALPIYLIFSRPRLRGYKKLVRKMAVSAQKHNVPQQKPLTPNTMPSNDSDRIFKTLESIAGTQSSTGNEVTLLVNGEQFLPALLADIREAKQQVNLCYYIFNEDETGRQVQQALLDAARRGVTVWLLYDKVGSSTMSNAFAGELTAGGVRVEDFHTRRGWWNFFEVNCRNHRKIAVIDHSIAHLGGINIGDEYMGKSILGFWRDTQIRIQGPEVWEIETIFLGDWAWATQESVADYSDNVPPEKGNSKLLTIATGCTDQYDECIMFFLSLINRAEKRLWITTPYFVPDESIIQALNLAVARGVDVRLLVPEKGDHYVPELAGLYYCSLVARQGIKVYQYTSGIMHQKVILVDDIVTAIGSANLDNRSLKISFEVMTAVAGREFAEQIAAMLEQDFENSTWSDSLLEHRALPVRIAANLARLLSPIL